MEYLSDFFLMLQLLTRIPINKSFPCEMKNFKDGSAFFALVGLFIGLMQYGVYSLLSIFLSVKASSIFAILFGIIITGGLHIDGLGDTCDGFFAFKGRDKVIEIMKDSRIGTFACIAIVFDILAKYIFISDAVITCPGAVLIVPPVVGRASIAFLAAIGNRAKEKGSGNLFIKNVGVLQLVVNLITVLAVVIYFTGLKGMILPLCAVILTCLFNILCNKKMDGITGDSFGANNEIVEILVLALVSAI